MDIVKSMVSKITELANNKTIRNGSLFSLYSFFNKGVSFILMVILARYLIPKEYGELSLFNTLTMFLSYFVGLQTAGYLSISYFKERSESFKKDFTAICIITCSVSVLILCMFVIFANFLSNVLKLAPLMIFLGLSTSFFQVFFNLNLDYQRIQEKIGIYGIFSCSYALLNMFLCLYFVVIADLSWKGRVYSVIICDLIYGIVSILYFYKKRLFSIPSDWKRYKIIILWGLPIIPHMASNWIKQGIDRYIIEYYHTISDVGIFSFSLNIASIMLMLGTAFNATNSVELYQILSSNLKPIEKLKYLKKKEKYFIILYIICALIIMIVGSISVPLLMPKYTYAVPYFLILNIFAFFKCIYFLYCNYLFYYSKTKNLMYITFSTSVIHLFLSLMLTRYSLYYTCILYVLSEFSICLLTYFLSQKYLKEKCPIKD